MEQDWIFHTGDYSCDLRVAGVLVRDGKLLVQRDADGSEYALPGGHVHLGETLEDALLREYHEETGAAIRCRKMLWSEECFWEWKGRKHHNMCFYYLIELCDSAALPDLGQFIPHKDNSRVVIGWLPLQQLRDATIYPEFIKQEIDHLDGGMKHFVTRA